MEELTPDRLTALSREIMSRPWAGQLLSFPFNLVKYVQSQANAAEYWFILDNYVPIEQRLAIISLPLPEYLCFSGHNAEVYDLTVQGLGFKCRTSCRIDSDLWEIVYSNEQHYIQTFRTRIDGIPSDLKNPLGEEYLKVPLKSLFSIALVAPVVEDEVANTALRRSLLRLAVTGLNRFADCHRRHVGIAWSTVPHYSFFSFPYGYIREFDLGGSLISSEKYLMNPALGHISELPYINDPDGLAYESFSKSLASEEDDDTEFTMFCKGEAYVGHGHDLAAIRFCVSAVDCILKRWARESGADLRGINPEKARLKLLLGKFEERLRTKRLVPNANDFMSQVRSVVNLRHAVEHEGLSQVDSTILFPAIETLKRFFDIVRKEIAAERHSHPDRNRA